MLPPKVGSAEKTHKGDGSAIKSGALLMNGPGGNSSRSVTAETGRSPVSGSLYRSSASRTWSLVTSYRPGSTMPPGSRPLRFNEIPPPVTDE